MNLTPGSHRFCGLYPGKKALKSLMFYRFEITSIIRQYPALFYPLITINNRIRGFNWPAYINKNTEFVIEGYFRSGNTFAVRAFSVAQQRPVKLANHTHAVATVLLAINRNIPTLILLRKPADTVTSATLKNPGTTIQQHLRWYIRYYEKVYQLRTSLSIALFDELVQDFGCVIHEVNKRFNTHFTPFNHTSENAKDVLAWIEEMDCRIYSDDTSRYSLPLPEKEILKNHLNIQIEIDNPLLMEKANNLYHVIAKNR